PDQLHGKHHRHLAGGRARRRCHGGGHLPRLSHHAEDRDDPGLDGRQRPAVRSDSSVVCAGRAALREGAGQSQRAQLGAQSRHDARAAPRHRLAGTPAGRAVPPRRTVPARRAAAPRPPDPPGPVEPTRPAEPTRPPAEPPRREPAPVAPAPRAEPPKGTADGPKITINQPPPDTRITDEKILVTGLVSDNVEIVRVKVLVNGVEAPSLLDAGTIGRGVPVGVLADLRPGTNAIEVVATNKAGKVARETRTVTRVTGADASAAAPTPAAGAAPKIATRWAVVIGVGDYENKSVPKLRFADADADAMYRLLTTRAGYERENVLLLTDKAPEKPTLD